MQETSSYSVTDAKKHAPFSRNTEKTNWLYNQFLTIENKLRKMRFVFFLLIPVFISLSLFSLSLLPSAEDSGSVLETLPLWLPMFFLGSTIFHIIVYKISEYKPKRRKYALSESYAISTKESALSFIYDLMYFFCKHQKSYTPEEFKDTYEVYYFMCYGIPAVDDQTDLRRMLAENEEIEQTNSEGIRDVQESKRAQEKILQTINGLYNEYIHDSDDFYTASNQAAYDVKTNNFSIYATALYCFVIWPIAMWYFLSKNIHVGYNLGSFVDYFGNSAYLLSGSFILAPIASLMNPLFFKPKYATPDNVPLTILKTIMLALRILYWAAIVLLVTLGIFGMISMDDIVSILKGFAG